MGRPVSSDTADACLDALLEAWSPAETGAEAVVSALLGEYNPGGKLPVSVAYHAGQIPVYYNHPNGSAWHQGGEHRICKLCGYAPYAKILFRAWPFLYYICLFRPDDFGEGNRRTGERPDRSGSIRFSFPYIGSNACMHL